MKTENYLSTYTGDMSNSERINLDNWRKAWVKALRSGKYQQGKGALRDGEGFCCLGVLADLAVKAGHGEWEGLDYCIGDAKDARELPLKQDYRWIGHLLNSPRKLTEINDNGLYSFKDIAKIIEDRQVLLPNGAIL